MECSISNVMCNNMEHNETANVSIQQFNQKCMYVQLYLIIQSGRKMETDDDCNIITTDSYLTVYHFQLLLCLFWWTLKEVLCFFLPLKKASHKARFRIIFSLTKYIQWLVSKWQKKADKRKLHQLYSYMVFNKNFNGGVICMILHLLL